jgi:threonine/homoserine/homoserine lactone efflux protein
MARSDVDAPVAAAVPAKLAAATQALALGAGFWVIGAIWDLTFAAASGTIGTWLQHRPRIRATQTAWQD